MLTLLEIFKEFLFWNNPKCCHHIFQNFFNVLKSLISVLTGLTSILERAESYGANVAEGDQSLFCHKMINTEHSVSWSTVIREQPIVRPNFRGAFSYAQLHIILLIFLHKKPVDWHCLYNEDPTLFQHLNQICIISDDHIFLISSTLS